MGVLEWTPSIQKSNYNDIKGENYYDIKIFNTKPYYENC